MAIPTFTLRTVTLDDELDRFLPDYESLGLSPQFSKPGTVRITYPSNGKNFDLLGDDVEIAVLMNGTEVTELRCIIESSEGNDASEAGEGQTWVFTARTMLGLLDRAVVYPRDWPVANPPVHAFVSATPGEILGELLTRAQNRGAIQELTWGFTDTHDSAGILWAEDTLDISFDSGTKYSQVVQNLVDNGLIEVRTNGRILGVYNKDGLGDDLSVGENPLRFTKGRDISESPRKSSTRELATTALVAGDNNVMAETSSPSEATWGRRESYYSQQGIISSGMLQFIGGIYLDTVSRPIQEVTHALFFDGEGNPVPIDDFQVGDWTLSDVGHGWERFRVKQWVVDIANSGAISGSVVLNDLIAERIEKLNRKLESIGSGITGVGSSEQKDDGKSPAQVTGVGLGSDYYLQNGEPRAVVTASWSAVTTNADGSDITDLDGYRVRWRYTAEANWHMSQTVSNTDLVAFFDNINPNTGVEVEVAAFDRYNRQGDWSDPVSITTAKDEGAPERPSAPVVTSVVGTLRLVWDGKDHAGNPMAADLAGVEVHVGPNGVFTPDSTTLKDYLLGPGPIAVTVTGLTYGQEYWVRLVAVDTSDNKSDGSDETATSHAVMRQVVNLEIGSGQVGLDNTRFSDVGNLVEDGSFENADLRSSRAAQMVGTDMMFDDTTASNGTWSWRISSQDPWVTQELVLQSGLPVKPGERIFGAADYKASIDSSETSSAMLCVRWYDKDGVLIDNAGNPGTDESYYALATSYLKVVRDNTWQRRLVFDSQLAPTNANSFNVVIRTIFHSAGILWMDGIEVRKQIDTLLIRDAAITEAKIALLAVNDAHIANLNVGKLIAGTLNADITVSARIKTANSGARAEMSSLGFEAYNSSGTRTFQASSAGTVSLIGELKTGASGERIVINPTASSIPEMRFYAATGTEYGEIKAVTGFDNLVRLEMGGSWKFFPGSASDLRGHITIGTGFVKMETQDPNEVTLGGYVEARNTQAEIGWFDAGLPNDGSSINMLSDGKIRFTGEISYWGDSTDAILSGRVDWSGVANVGSLSCNYGATLATAPIVVANVFDDTSAGSGIGCNIRTITTSGFTAHFTKLANGTSGSVFFWAWRN